MSSIIESVARGAKQSITGTDASQQEMQQTARGHDLIKQLAMGGLAIGGGVSAAVALINHLKSIKKEDEVFDEDRLNDDTLYIDASGGREKSAEVNRWVAPGLAVTGGLLTAGGSYALTQAVYNYLQKKRRQRLLDDAQSQALAEADVELNKAAETKMSFSDLVTAFPVAVPLLAALASGGISYAALRKTFPTVKKPKSKYPRRIRQVSKGGDIEKLDEDLMPKAASVRDISGEADCEAAANEFLLLMTDQMSFEKSAQYRLTSDLLARAATDGVRGLTATLRDGGIPALVESVSGASDSDVGMPKKAMAAALLCKSARLAPVACALAAAEFNDLAPGIAAAVAEQPEDHMDKMAGVGALLHMSFFRPAMLDKSAMAAGPMSDELAAILGEDPGALSALAGEDMEEALTSDASGSFTEDNEGDESITDELEEDDIQGQTAVDPVDDLLDFADTSEITEDLHTDPEEEYVDEQ